MKFKIEKNELFKLLKFGDRITSENKGSSFNPILSFLYLKIRKSGSIAICSNYLASGLYNLDNSKIEIEEEGDILIRPKLLLNIISKLKEKTIILNKFEESALNIKTESFNAQINTVDENSFPNTNFDYKNFEEFQISYATIHKISQKVAWAALNSGEQAKILNGVLFDTETKPGFLSTVATDSYKLSYLCEPVNISSMFKFVLDTNIIKILIDLMKSDSEADHMTLYLDKQSHCSNIIIKIDNMLLQNKTIEGAYPTSVYNAFNIAKNTVVKVDRNEFISSLERGQFFVSNEKNPMVTLNIHENGIAVDFVSYELGASQENVKVNHFEGSGLKISLNTVFLINLLKTIEAEEVVLEFESNTKPVIVYAETDQQFKELVLPLRTN
ncbi:DNA polymerase III subunit beta [Ureaplasma ceti]|uniref:DNA polymerase III subunit beta n=1 Tax=Ureaplasma ceti TaxID=3119530 RepID=A0ABP9U9W0_9BACT